MPSRLRTRSMIFATFLFTLINWLALANRPQQLSDVVSITDLEMEVKSLTAELQAAAISLESFQGDIQKRQAAATQLAVIAQAMVDHDADSPMKVSAPAVRDAALRYKRATDYDAAKMAALDLKTALEQTNPTVSTPAVGWSNLTSKRAIMESLRERSDRVRKAMRRSKDPALESRNAAVMAVLAVALAEVGDEISVTADRRAWKDWSIEMQRELTKTATAMAQKDPAATLQHFSAAQAACEKCHEKFKK